MNFGRRFITIVCFNITLISAAFADGKASNDVDLLKIAIRQSYEEFDSACSMLEKRTDQCIGNFPSSTPPLAPPSPQFVAQLLTEIDSETLLPALFFHSMRNTNQCVFEQEKNLLFHIEKTLQLYNALQDSFSRDSSIKDQLDGQKILEIKETKDLLGNISAPYLELQAQYNGIPDRHRRMIENIPGINAGKFSAFEIIEEAKKLNNSPPQ